MNIEQIIKACERLTQDETLQLINHLHNELDLDHLQEFYRVYADEEAE